MVLRLENHFNLFRFDTKQIVFIGQGCNISVVDRVVMFDEVVDRLYMSFVHGYSFFYRSCISQRPYPLYPLRQAVVRPAIVYQSDPA